MTCVPVLRILLPVLLALARWPGAWAGTADCNTAIRAAERAEELPRGLLAAMGRVESGRRTGRGNVEPWPWTVNARGEGHAFETRGEALRKVRRLQMEGVRLIDVGCLQINLHHHPQAFASLEEAFSPQANARYAARFLRRLKERQGDWMRAVAHYHSGQAERGGAYRQRVLLAMRGEPPPASRTEAARAPSSVSRPHPRALNPEGSGEASLWLRAAEALPGPGRR
ncbi:transglycosylase SLT domain-containing protein [Teichococcus aestuarii]|uniref:transglycosylase SLT domain-containing protein n=1 Tax=Teichococcus aestuarii TaxID=568898 RepID=UPI00361D0BF0